MHQLQKRVQYLGPLTGKEFRAGEMRIAKVEQNSESIHVDSEASLNKRVKKEPKRSFFKSQTYTQQKKEEMESPEQSITVPLHKISDTVIQQDPKIRIQNLPLLFVKKLQYLIKKSKQHLSTINQHNHLIRDKGSNYDNLITDTMLDTLRGRTFHRMQVDLVFAMYLIMYIIISALIMIQEVPDLMVLLVFLQLPYAWLDRQSSLMMISIVLNLIAIQYHYLFVFNFILIYKLQQINISQYALTMNHTLQLLIHSGYVLLYAHCIACLRALINDIQYWDSLSYEVNAIFSFESLGSGLVDTLINISNKLWFMNLAYRLINVIREDLVLYDRYQSLKVAPGHFRNQYSALQKTLDQLQEKQQYLIVQKSVYSDALSKGYTNLTEDIRNELSKEIKEVHYEEGDLLQQEGQLAQQLYILIEGTLQLQLLGRTLKVIKQGLVNEIEFFVQGTAQYTIRAASRVRIGQISIERVRELCILSDRDAEEIAMLADRVKYNPQRRAKYRFCDICDSKNHFTLQCPCVFFVPDRKKIMSNSTYSLENSRKRIHRFERKRYNSLVNQNLISITAVCFGNKVYILAQSRDLISRTDMVDLYLGNDKINEDTLFNNEDDYSKYNRTQTLHSMTGRERQYTDSQIKTLTVKTLKQSEHRVAAPGESVIATSSQQIRPPGQLKLAPQRIEQKRSSNSLSIEREKEKKSSLQSQIQQIAHSTSILQSQLVPFQSAHSPMIGSPMINSPIRLASMSKSKDQSAIIFYKSDTQPIVSDLIAVETLKDLDVHKYYSWYFPQNNWQIVFQKYQSFVSAQFAKAKY